MPDISFFLDEIVPAEEEFDWHLQQIAGTNPLPEPKRLWEYVSAVAP